MCFATLQDLEDTRFLTWLQKLVEKSKLAENVLLLLNKALHNKYPKFSTSKQFQVQELLSWNFWPEIIKIFGKFKLLMVQCFTHTYVFMYAYKEI